MIREIRKRIGKREIVDNFGIRKSRGKSRVVERIRKIEQERERKRERQRNVSFFKPFAV